MDNDVHKKYTSVSNIKIIENLIKLSKTGKDIVVTVPIIKGINNSISSLNSMILLLKSLDQIPKVQILPYHSLYISKSEKLGGKPELFSTSTDSELSDIRLTFISRGIEIYDN